MVLNGIRNFLIVWDSVVGCFVFGVIYLLEFLML